MRSSFIVFGVTAALIVAGAAAFHPSARAGAPRLPTDDAEVLQRTTAGAGDRRTRREAELRRALAVNPADLATALRLARFDIEQARARSDPRFLGYAQAALARWWDDPAAPADVLVLRATIRQSLHDFVGSLADLDVVVARDPDNAQAWITRSVVLTVRGRYDEALASCAPLERLSPPLVSAVCVGSVEAVTGRAESAYARIENALVAAASVTPDEHAWAASTLAETATRLGRVDDAERQFRVALAVDPNDGYVLGAFADLLLDAGRAPEVVRLLADRTDNDGLLLRLTLAETATGSPEARGHADMIAARFDAAHLRGDRLHLREESRFELGLRHDAARALAVAVEDFAIQKEPWDVRVFVEAAAAARRPDAALPVLDFLDAHRLEDPHITTVARSLRPAGAP
jgi:tetratricopeptide (TPR) repeat protein